MILLDPNAVWVSNLLRVADVADVADPRSKMRTAVVSILARLAGPDRALILTLCKPV